MPTWGAWVRARHEVARFGRQRAEQSFEAWDILSIKGALVLFGGGEGRGGALYRRLRLVAGAPMEGV